MGPAVLGIIALTLGLLLASLITRLSVRQVRHAVLAVVLGLGSLLLAVLLYSGRIGFAVLVGSYLVWLWRVGRAGAAQGPATGRGETGDASRGAGMDVAQALEILGLQAGASRSEIDAAYKALMVKNHPDQGGTDWLAARLNEARDTLLNQTK